MSNWEINIGLEVHVQLATQTKMFSPCLTEFGGEPNSQVRAICLGMPGTLPIANREAFHLAIKAGLALNCEIAEHTRFDRKNYFYPDLPKGYQISQFNFPICQNGHLMIDTSQGEKKIGIIRAHLEEDAGKIIHEKQTSYIDLNRAGVPLLEIVSAPDIASAEEADSYFRELRNILLCLQVSDCNMQEGSLRCDANVSVRLKDEKEMGTRTEIKNLNSFNFIRRAIRYEAQRQIALLEKGEKVVQGTYTWDEEHEITRLMRTKEEAQDYRYFPEPDLGNFIISEEMIQAIESELPELPRQRRERFLSEYGLEPQDIQILLQNYAQANFFEECVKKVGDAQEVANWITGAVRTYLNDKQIPITEFPLSAEHLGELLLLLQNKTITRNAAKEIFAQMIETGKSAKELAKSKEKIKDPDVLGQMCQEVLEANPGAAEDYQKNPKAINSLVGQVMKKSQGRADVAVVKKILQESLK